MSIMTQWGSVARPFQDYGIEERQELLLHARGVIEQVNSKIGVRCFLAYGVLLGAVRSGSLIAHDFDIDLAFMPQSGLREDVPEATERLTAFLIEQGYTIKVTTN